MLSTRIALFARAYYSYVENKLICKDSLICKFANKPIFADKHILADKPILADKQIQSDVSVSHSVTEKHIAVFFTIHIENGTGLALLSLLTTNSLSPSPLTYHSMVLYRTYYRDDVHLILLLLVKM